VPIAPLLQPGLDAYRGGDLAAAAERWEAAAATLTEAAECDLAMALGALASSLAARKRGEGELAARRFAEAEASLSALPDAVLGVDVLALRAELARGLAAATTPPPVTPWQRFPLGVTLRFLALLLLLVGGALALRFTPLAQLLERERMVRTFLQLRESTWAPLVLIGLCVGLAPVGLPMTPLIIASGVVFGPRWGALYNIVGCVLGAAASFGLARLLGRDFVRRIAGKRLKRIEKLLRRRGFWSLVGVRFLPVPFPVVNFGAALAGVPFGIFLLTSVLGLTPALLVYTNFAATLFEVARGGERTGLLKAAVSFGAVMLLSLTPAVVQRVRRRQRYRRLVVERHARARRPIAAS
jgi:uncharacterized membrane protein YdjX (TVP38/TMEM64 family)